MALATILETLLGQDGIDLPRGGGAEKAIACFNPAHDDDSPSMSVNVSKGLYNCHGCGVRGNAYQYLTDFRRLEPAEAMQTLQDLGGSEAYANSMRKQFEANEEKNRRDPPSTSDIYGKARITKTLMGDRTALYDYTDPAGKVEFKVGRYEASVDGEDKPKKTFRPFTPKKDGTGYWVVSPRSEQLPLEGRIDHYPIYRLKTIAAAVRSWTGMPDGQRGQIWVVEGEKCADLLSRVDVVNAQGAKRPPPLTCSLYGGSKHPLEHHDLTILYGQRVLLLADADRNGREYMKKLGKHLAEFRSEVRYFMPDGTDGHDVGDAAATGWAGVMDFITRAGGVKGHEEVFTVAVDETKQPMDLPMIDTPYFRIMGFEDRSIVIQSKRTHKIHKLAASSVGAMGNLIVLAPLHFWKQMAGGKDPAQKHRDVWADAMIRAAEERGEMSTQSVYMWSRGAHKDRTGKVIYNVGNGILEADDSGLLNRMKPLMQDVETSEIYLPGPKIDLYDDEQAFQYGAELYDAISGYRWEREEHGQAFLGWIVASLIGGALPFRPMLWLTALPDTGKTFLLEFVVKALFGNLVTDWANVSEAAMAAQTSFSALPAYLDEFEPKPGKERRIDDILALVRVATSGGAARTRATQTGEFYQARPRFSLLMASIDRPALSDADSSRIMPIRLDAAGVQDWPIVRDKIIQAVDGHRARSIVTNIIRNTQRIVEHAKEIEDELLTENLSTRESQQRAALSAGVAFLSADEGFRLSRQRRGLADKYRAMSTLMQSMVRSRFEEDVTVADALKQGYFEVDGKWVPDAWLTEEKRKLRAATMRHGFRFIDEEWLYAAIDWKGMRDLLQHTQYQNIDLSEYLLRLPGAHRPKSDGGAYVRVTFAGQTRAVIAIPRSTLAEMGLFVFD